ncbi:KxYKxGKxW signal peptide domain-containing protein [Lacticaseibacillus manihotivorans]|uniref:KxYKxGKxW signal peptide domain-containing protein n=1 Tax=Lacticaseibacillus manihotivorans TaxID=88233 RepID=UPI000AA0D03E|nr:KxYKxGKxW signal peptide domain-containing protein [Lacticaseibacillus manihotivorans]
MRKNNHHSILTTEVKSRVKMWRSGKNWVYGLLFFFGMAGISFGQANLVHADTTALSAETEKGTIASQLTDRAVPLQTSISKSADDSTTTATSDSEPDISGTNAEQLMRRSRLQQLKQLVLTQQTRLHQRQILNQRLRGIKLRVQRLNRR